MALPWVEISEIILAGKAALYQLWRWEWCQVLEAVLGICRVIDELISPFAGRGFGWDRIT
jgi:hypothetical protein